MNAVLQVFIYYQGKTYKLIGASDFDLHEISIICNRARTKLGYY
jgi:hypothetical protein